MPHPPPDTKASQRRYLALGDSYTIGTGVLPGEAFPALLVRFLEAATGNRVDVRNPAVNGYTTEDLIEHELRHLEGFRPDLVTLLIGVNDMVQRVPMARYRENLARIHDAIAALAPPATAVVGVSIPDFSYTPAASLFGEPAAILEETRLRNAAARDLTEARGWRFIDIVDASRSGIGLVGWLAADGLHPGARQHATWAERIWTEIAESWAQ
jgi:lysophospholipase L1-like esterase